MDNTPGGVSSYEVPTTCDGVDVICEGERYAVIANFDGDPLISFADPSSSIGQQSWDDIFNNQGDSLNDYTVSEMVGYLVNADLSNLGAFFDTYYDVIGAGYGIDSTLYDFAELEECGTIAAVPERGHCCR